MPPLPPQPAAQHGGYGDQPYAGHQQHQHQQQHHPQQHYPSQQQYQHHGAQNQQEEPYDQVEKLLTKLVKKYCCAVM
jgi:hypothetical protein